MVQWNSPVVETSAGEPLISTRPFAVMKWSAWLVSKKSPLLWDANPRYTKIYYNVLPHPVPSSPYRQHTKNTKFTKTLCSQYCGKTKRTCRNVCIWSSGGYNGWPVSRHEPLDTTPCSFLAPRFTYFSQWPTLENTWPMYLPQYERPRFIPTYKSKHD